MVGGGRERTFGTGRRLQDVDALLALFQILGDHRLVHLITQRYEYWGDLAQSSSAERMYRIGAWAASLVLPPECPPCPDLGSGIFATTRYEAAYPARLTDLPDPPVCLFVRGQLPNVPMAAIGGSYYPSVGGLAIAAHAAKVAVSCRLPVVAAIDGGCGQRALEATVAYGGQAVAVVAADLALTAIHTRLAEQILERGGALVSEWGPGEGFSEQRLTEGTRLVAGLATAVVLAELGVYPTDGAALAKAAIVCSRFTVVPAPLPDALTALTATGARTLADPWSFSERIFGVHERIRARISVGSSPADAVVTTDEELAKALRASCGRTR